LEVHVTEMDVRIRGKPTEKVLAQQARVYRDIVNVCLSARGCTALVFWGFTDRHSWIPSSFPG
jgi:endo-1,4-beta-xylanase